MSRLPELSIIQRKILILKDGTRITPHSFHNFDQNCISVIRLVSIETYLSSYLFPGPTVVEVVDSPSNKDSHGFIQVVTQQCNNYQTYLFRGDSIVFSEIRCDNFPYPALPQIKPAPNISRLYALNSR